MKFLLFIHFQHNSEMKHSLMSLPEWFPKIGDVPTNAIEMFAVSLIGDVTGDQIDKLTLIFRNKSVIFFGEINGYYENAVVRGQICLHSSGEALFAAVPVLTLTDNFVE